jgi:nucleoside-diphosphate-sugar epimerase
MTRVLLAGATGYVGGHIARALHGAGHEITALVRSAEKAQAVEAQGMASIVADIGEIGRLSAGFEAIVFAPQLAHDAEAVVIEHLLDAIRGTGKALLFTSGTGVFAEITGGDWSDTSFAEQDSFPASDFASARVGTERRIVAAASDGVRGMIFRPPLIWGHGGSRHVPFVFDSVEKTGAACHIGRGLNLYSHVHIDDVAALYLLALENGKAGAIYHAVAGEESFRSIAQAVGTVTGAPIRSISLDEAVALWGDRPARFMFNVCSRARAPRSRTELGWRPQHVDLIEDILTGSYRDRYAPA